MVKRLLLLDIDDTICNASEAYNIALLKCYDYLKKIHPLIGKDIFVETYMKARKEVHLELGGSASMHNRFLYFQRLFEILGLPFHSDVLDKVTDIYWNETYRNLRLYPGVKETLRVLKDNSIKVGVISDLIAHVQAKKLKRLGVSKYIDFMVTSEEAGKEKPHPAIFLLALRKAGCLPHEAIMVGDSVKKDIIGAKHVGITGVLYRGAKGEINEEEGPHVADHVIDDFKQLLAIFDVKRRRTSKRKMVVFDLMGSVFEEGNIMGIMLPIVKKGGIKISHGEMKELYLKYSRGEITGKEFHKIVPENVEREFLDSIKIDKEAIPTLEWLKKRGYLLGVLSNVPERWGNYLLEKFGLRGYFSAIVFSGEMGRRKSDEELYRTFLERSNVKPENCYLVDDNLKNLREARFFLMKTVWVKRKKQKITFVPDHMITRLSKLKKIFSR